jgi:hypothetical protein
MQGERDARFPEAGRQYKENLGTLISHFLQDLDAPDVPFLLGHVNPPAEAYPAVEEVRAAQASVARAVDNARLVSTTGLSKHPDNLHYDAAGQIELGQRFAQAFLEAVGADPR